MSSKMRKVDKKQKEEAPANSVLKEFLETAETGDRLDFILNGKRFTLIRISAPEIVITKAHEKGKES